MFKRIMLSFTLLFVTVLGVQMYSTQVTFAATQEECDAEKAENFLGLPKWYKYLEISPDNSGKCSVNIDEANAILPIVIAVVEAMIRLGGLVAVVMVIIGSFRYITSQGNADNAAAARKTIINSLVGLAIVILSTTVVSFVGNRLNESAGGETGMSEPNYINRENV